MLTDVSVVVKDGSVASSQGGQSSCQHATYGNFSPCYSSGMKVPQLRTVREHKLLTQRDLAEKAGISQTTIVRIEEGQAAALSTIRKLADALEVQLL
jgi:DNA-binding XRE family transcriptional regulator